MIPVAVIALMPLVVPPEHPSGVSLYRQPGDLFGSKAWRTATRNPDVEMYRQSDVLFDGAAAAETRFRELVQHAHERYAAGELDKSLNDLTAAIKIEPEWAQLWFWRATVRADKKEYDKALSDIDEAFKLDPTSAAILASRGAIRHLRGELGHAEFDLTFAISLDPKCGPAWRNRGAVRAAKGEYELAVADFTQAIELNATVADYYIRRGAVRALQQDWEKAADDYSKAIELDPKSVLVLCCRGYARLEQREYDKAFDDYTRAVELDPKSAAARTGRGLVYAARYDDREAIAEYEKAIEHDPKWTDTLYYLTYLYAIGADTYLRDPKKAVARGKQLVEAAPFEWWAQQALAVAHAEAGDFDAAVTGMRKVLESDGLSHDDRETAERYVELFLANKPLSSERE